MLKIKKIYRLKSGDTFSWLKFDQDILGGANKIPTSCWVGSGINGFALASRPNPKQMELLSSSKSIDDNGGIKFLKRSETYSDLIGYQATFFAPKSFSVLFMLADYDEREHLLRKQHQAIDQAIFYLEKNIYARTGKNGGGPHIATNGIVGSLHTKLQTLTSKSPRCQIDTHVIIYNVINCNDGLYRSPCLDRIVQHCIPAAAAIYRAHLAWLLREDGFEILQQKILSSRGTIKSHPYVSGIPQVLCDLFSERSKEIASWRQGRLSNKSGNLNCIVKSLNLHGPFIAPSHNLDACLKIAKLFMLGLTADPLPSIKQLRAKLPQTTVGIDDLAILSATEKNGLIPAARLVEEIAMTNMGNNSANMIEKEIISFINRNNLEVIVSPRSSSMRDPGETLGRRL